MKAGLAAEVTCILPARPEVVYEEWVDVEAFKEWMCPRPARPLAIDIDPRVGGRLRIDIEEPGRRFYVLGRYLMLDRPKLISFTWSCSTWVNPDHESVVDVRLEPHGEEETRMTITHSLLPPDLLEQHEAGWQQIARQLHKEVETSAHLSDRALPGKARGG